MSNFWDIFKDTNDINEKNIVGFVSFAVMVIVAGIDVVTSLMGIPFVINDYIYNSFLIVTLGSFGISEAGKAITRYQDRNDRHTPNDYPEN